MNITKIVVVTGSGADTCVCTTDLPGGCWPYKENQIVTFKVASGSGVDYCEKHFPGVALEVV